MKFLKVDYNKYISVAHIKTIEIIIDSAYPYAEPYERISRESYNITIDGEVIKRCDDYGVAIKYVKTLMKKLGIRVVTVGE